MKNLQSLKRKTSVFILLACITFIPFDIIAQGEYLIVRIVDADYPPEESVYEDENWTGFTITIYYQVENPTSSPIVIPYSCGPYPFPYMRINLRDKKLRVIRDYNIKWIAGETTIQPGNRTGKYKCYFAVENYVNYSLPIGNYKFWFDFTNCSVSPVPVITEKMYIDVTETSIIYYFDYNNESRVVSTVNQSHYTNSLLVITFPVTASLYQLYKRRKHT